MIALPAKLNTVPTQNSFKLVVLSEWRGSLVSFETLQSICSIHCTK